MLENLIGTYEEMPIDPGINVYTITFNSEADLRCCIASVSEIDANGKLQVAAANLTVMNTGIVSGKVPNEWIVSVRIESSWRNTLKCRIALLCM